MNKAYQNYEIERQFKKYKLMIIAFSLLVSAYLFKTVHEKANESIYFDSIKEAEKSYEHIASGIDKVKNIANIAIIEIEKQKNKSNVQNFVNELIHCTNVESHQIEQIEVSTKNNKYKVLNSEIVNLKRKNKLCKPGFNQQIYMLNKQQEHIHEVSIGQNSPNNTSKGYLYILTKKLNSDIGVKLTLNIETIFDKIKNNELIEAKKERLWNAKKLKKNALIYIRENSSGLIKIYKKESNFFLNKIVCLIACDIEIGKDELSIYLESNTSGLLRKITKKLAPTLFFLITFNASVMTILNRMRKNFIIPTIDIIENNKLQNSKNIANNIIINKNHSLTEYSIISNSIGKIKEYTAHNILLNKKIAQQNKELKTIKDAKLEFMSYMSHEIRTPLNTLTVSSEIINKQLFGKIYNKKYLEYTGLIYSSSKKLSNTIQNLLYAFQIESGIIKLDKSHININNIIARCAQKLKTQNNNIKIVENYGQSRLLPFDQIYGEKAIYNILDTIISLSSEEPITIAINTILENQDNDEYIYTINISIQNLNKDSASYISYYFKKEDGFSKLTSSSKELSIALAKQLVKIQNGSIKVDSEERIIKIQIAFSISTS